MDSGCTTDRTVACHRCNSQNDRQARQTVPGLVTHSNSHDLRESGKLGYVPAQSRRFSACCLAGRLWFIVYQISEYKQICKAWETSGTCRSTARTRSACVDGWLFKKKCVVAGSLGSGLCRHPWAALKIWNNPLLQLFEGLSGLKVLNDLHFVIDVTD